MKKFCIYSLIASTTLLLIITQSNTFQASEAKKLIKLKDLKKAKKYGYLLATQRKKFYAVPVPFPLPVIVKRQQIYTQVPVVPRYVEQAPTQQQYVQMGYGEPYEAYMASGSQYSSPQDYQQPPQQALGYSKMSLGQMGGGGLGGAGSAKGKYLSGLANALGQAYPVLGAAQGVVAGNVVGKLLSGQAKVLPPSQIKSLLFSSKGAASYKGAGKQEQGDRGRDYEPEGRQQSKEGGNSTASKQEQEHKPSASEAYYSSIPFEHYQRGRHYLRHPTAAGFYGPPIAYQQQQQQQAHFPAYHAHYQPTRIIPTLVAPSAIYAPPAGAHFQAQQMALAAEMMQELMAASAAGSADISAESSNVEPMQPQETLETPQAIERVQRQTEAKGRSTAETRLRQQALKAALIRHRLMEAQLAQELGLTRALADHHLRLINISA